MKTFNPFLYFIILFGITASLHSQTIKFYPKTANVYLVDGCTGTCLSYSESKIGEVDSIKMSADFNTYMCYADSAGMKIAIPFSMFIVNKMSSIFNYELYLCPPVSPEILIPPDSMFKIEYIDYRIKLIVKKENEIVDSLSQQFHSSWGLGVEQNDLSSLPEKCELFTNYPNPFNPTTKIRYSLPKSGHVTMKVYDILGKEVSTLVNEYKSAGSYEVEFHAEGLSSGIYFYTLRSGVFMETKKLVLIK